VVKSDAVAADEGLGTCDEAPGVVDGNRRGCDGGGDASGKISASSTRVGLANLGTFPATPLMEPDSDCVAMSVAFGTHLRQLNGDKDLRVFVKSKSLTARIEPAREGLPP
jgi:hypothetical protein